MLDVLWNDNQTLFIYHNYYYYLVFFTNPNTINSLFPRGGAVMLKTSQLKQRLRVNEVVVYTMALPPFTAFGQTGFSQVHFQANHYLRCKATKAPTWVSNTPAPAKITCGNSGHSTHEKMCILHLFNPWSDNFHQFIHFLSPSILHQGSIPFVECKSSPTTIQLYYCKQQTAPACCSSSAL